MGTRQRDGGMDYEYPFWRQRSRIHQQQQKQGSSRGPQRGLPVVAEATMGQKSRALVNGSSPGSLEKRKKDKSVVVLEGLVSDLARRAQSAIDGNGPTQHLESIRAIHRLLGQIQKLERPFVIQPNSADISARLKVLEDWLQLQGVPIVGLTLEGGLQEGAGVVAQQKFEKGQLLCTVPAHVMMTTATAIRSKDDVGILYKADPILRQMPTLILALHLLFEKHRPSEEPSNWAGYIQSLPGQGSPSESNSDNTDSFIMPLAFREPADALRVIESEMIFRTIFSLVNDGSKASSSKSQFCTMLSVITLVEGFANELNFLEPASVLFRVHWKAERFLLASRLVAVIVSNTNVGSSYSLETIEALKGTAVLVEMHKALRNYARWYAHVRLLLKQLRGQSMSLERANSWLTWAEFRWAASIVMTRQNPIPGTPDMEMNQALALIPYLDMFNHEEGDITCHFAVQQQQMELTAKRDFEAGEQVYISYGYRPNSALLLYSGFVPEHNSKDRIKVPVELPRSDPLYAKKAALLKWLDLPSSGWLELYHDGTPSQELATWVKVAIMQDLSVVTENLRATIASRARETAAILQYKAAMREAEEKAKRLGLQESEAPETISEIDDNLVTNASTVVDTETGSPESTGDALQDSTSNGVADLSANLQDEASEGKDEEPVAVNEPTEASELQETDMGAVSKEQTGLLTGGESEDLAQVEEDENGLDKQENASDRHDHESILGFNLFPAEAALLGEMCRSRITEFGDGFQKQPNGFSQDLPKGLGIGLGGPKVQPKSLSKELVMVSKIRQQEQAALLRAIERGSRYQHTHSNCTHCH